MPSKSSIDRFRGEMGETIVAYELMKNGWDVYRNVGGHGFDLLASSENGRVQRRIEVKTTDPWLRTGSTRNQLTVILTAAEMQMADFCVFYIHGHGFNTFFVIPKALFPSGGSITVNVGRDGQISRGTMFEETRDNWDALR